MRMDKVKEIEEAVRQLPEAELVAFRRWFAKFDAAAWDAQIERDASSGKLNVLAEEAMAEYHAGKSQEL